MSLTFRAPEPQDAAICGDIANRAFKSVSDQHGFPSAANFDTAVEQMSQRIAHPCYFGVVAEQDGHVVGSSFLDERGAISGLGPVTVAPDAQDSAVGRQLMERMLARVEERRTAGVRLVQAAYHSRALALYSKLGFVAREPLSAMQGTPPQISIPGREVLLATAKHLQDCDTVCLRVHGHDRHVELAEAIESGTATVVENAGKVSGYATVIGMRGHAVAVTNDDMKALIAAAPGLTFRGSIHVPTRNTELLRWCLDNGLRIVAPMTLMSIGLYNEPAGAYMPSILY